MKRKIKIVPEMTRENYEKEMIAHYSKDIKNLKLERLWFLKRKPRYYYDHEIRKLINVIVAQIEKDMRCKKQRISELEVS